jgi:hypothetical protein
MGKALGLTFRLRQIRRLQIDVGWIKMNSQGSPLYPPPPHTHTPTHRFVYQLLNRFNLTSKPYGQLSK